MMLKLDEKDRVIIRFLLENSRIPLTKISRVLMISDVAVGKRLRKLEDEGIIMGYTIKVNPTKIGYKGAAIVGLDVDPENLLEAINKLSHNDKIRYLALTTGDHTLIAEIWAEDSEELNRILNDIRAIQGVKNIRPAIILDIIKY